MGYYVAAPCLHAGARNDLLRFMGEHFRPASEFMDWVDPDDRMPPPANGKDICAYAKANQVGWYRNAGWDEEHRHYATCLLRWVARRVGKTMLVGEDQIPSVPKGTEVHFTLYEGEPHPFILRSLFPGAPDGWDAEGYAVCDDLGWSRGMAGPSPGEDPEFDAACSPYILELRKRKAKADPLIRAELERLSSLWNDHNRRSHGR